MLKMKNICFQHGTHSFEGQCDVCTEKISLDEFLLAKIEREKRQKEYKKQHSSSGHKHSSKSSSSSSSRRNKDEHRSRTHRSSGSRTGDKRHHGSGSSHRKSAGSSHDQKDGDKELHKERGGEKERNLTQLHAKEKDNIKRKDNKKDESKRHKSSHSRSSSTTSSSHRHRHPSGSGKERRTDHNKGTDSDSIKKIELTTETSTSAQDSNETERKMDGRSISKSPSENKVMYDSSKLKSTVDEEGKMTRKEVTDEDVAKAENLIKQALAASNTTAASAFDKPQDIIVLEESEATPSLLAENDGIVSPAVKDHSTELVTSTVNIKTPDTSEVMCDSNPVVWKGDISMQDVAKFSVTAKQVSGTTDYLTVDLKETLKIVGRIAPKNVWEYVSQVSEVPSKEILLVRLEPTTDDEKIDYDSFFNYLQQRNRLVPHVSFYTGIFR